MSLDVYLEAIRPDVVFERNITHNLGDMAREVLVECQGKVVSLYTLMWQPETINLTHAWQLVMPLNEALDNLLSDSSLFKDFTPKNCWGNYDGLCGFVNAYLEACCENPDAIIRVCR